MNWVKIDFLQSVKLLLPSFLRNTKQIILLKSLVAPLDQLFEQTLYKMQHDCSVISLEKMLNEYFNVVGYDASDHEGTKVVYIDDAPVPPTKYIYLNEEIPPKEYLYLGIQYLTGDVDHIDFIINIPSSFIFLEEKLIRVIEYYKLSGKKYKIEIL